MEIFMKYAVETGSDAMIYIPSFITIGSAIQKFIRGGYVDTETAWRTQFRNKESRVIQKKQP
jgi:hypothetical protein